MAAGTYSTKRFGEVPVLDAQASYDEESGHAAIFLVHRGMTQSLPLQIRWAGEVPKRVAEVQQMTGTDPKAANGFDRPEVIVPRRLSTPAVAGDTIHVKLPPMSFTMLKVDLRG